MKFKLIESFSNKKDLKLLDEMDLFNLKLYFISRNKSIKKLSPKLPNSVAPYEQENDKVKRICFAPSIDQCIKAIGNTDTTYYVYVPKKSLAGHAFYKCTIHEVMDSFITDEYWCLDDIEVTPVAKIHTGKKWILLGNEKYGWTLKYTIDEILDSKLDDYNILEDFALCTRTKYVTARVNEYMAELEFKNESAARDFYNKIMKKLNESRIFIKDNIVYYKAINMEQHENNNSKET